MPNTPKSKKDLSFVSAFFHWLTEQDYVVVLGKAVRAGIRGLFTWKGGGFVRTQLEELRHVNFANVRQRIVEDIHLLRGPNGWQAFQEKHNFDLELSYREIHDEYVRLANKAAKSKTYKRLLKPVTLVNDLQDLYLAVRHRRQVDRFLHQPEHKIEDILFDETHNEFPELQNELILFESDEGYQDYTEEEFLSKKEASNINAYGLSLTQTFQTIEDFLASFDKARNRPELNAWQVNFLESLDLYALGRMNQRQIFQKPVPRYLTFRALTSNPFFAARSKVGLLETKEPQPSEIFPRNKLLRAFHLRLSPDAALNRPGVSIYEEEISIDAPDYDSEKREWNSEEAATVGDLLDYVLRLNSFKGYRPRLRLRQVTGGWKERDISPRYVLVSTTAARMEDLDLSKYLNANRILNRKPFDQDAAIFYNNSTLASPLSNLYQEPSYYNQDALFMDPLYCLDFRDAFGSFVLTDEPQNPALQLASSEERLEPEDLPRLLTQQVPLDRLFSREEAAQLSALYLQKPVPAWKKEFQLQSKSFWQELQAKKTQKQRKETAGNPLSFLRSQPSLSARRSRWLEEKRNDLQMELALNILEREYLEPKVLKALENLMETAKGVIQQAGNPKEKSLPLFREFLDYIDFDSELMGLHQEYHSLVDQDLALEKALKSLGDLSSSSSMVWSDLKDMNAHYLTKEQRPRGQNVEQGWEKEWLEQKLARVKNHQKQMVGNPLEDQWTRFLLRDLPQTLWSELRELQEELMQTEIGRTWAEKLLPYQYNPHTYKKILEQKFELWEVKDLVQEMFAYLTTDLLEEAKVQAVQRKWGENPKVQSFLAQKERFKKKMQASPKYASLKKKVHDFLLAYESTFKGPKTMEFPRYQTEKDLDNLMADLLPTLEKNADEEEEIRPFLKKGAKFTDFAGYFQSSKEVDPRIGFDPTTDEKRALPLNLFSEDSELFFNWYCQISWRNWEHKAQRLNEQISKMSASSPIQWPFSEGSFQKEEGPVGSRHKDQALIQECKHSLKNLVKEEERHSKELKKVKEVLENIQMELQLCLFRQLNLLKDIQDQKEIRSSMNELHIVREVQPVKTLRKTSRSLLKKFQRKNAQVVAQKKERFVAAAPYLEFLMKKQEEWIDTVNRYEEKDQQLQTTILILKEYKSTLQSMERARTFLALQKKTHTQALVQQWKAAKNEFRTKKEDFLARWRRQLDEKPLSDSDMSMVSVEDPRLQQVLIQHEEADRKAAETERMAEEGLSKAARKGGWFSHSGFVAQAAERKRSTQSDSELREVLAQQGLMDLRLGEDPRAGKKQEGYFEKKDRLQKEQAEFEAFLYKDKPWWKSLKAKEAQEIRVKGLSTESLSYPLAIGSKANKKARKPIHFYLLKNSQGQVQPILPVETTEKQARDLWFQLKATNPLFKDLGNEPRFIQIHVDEFLERTQHLDFKEIKTLTLKNHEF